MILRQTPTFRWPGSRPAATSVWARPPASVQPWKGVVSRPDKAAFLEGYFRELRGLSTLGAELARTYGKRAKEIGLGLVKDGVARREEDVNTVMLTGFYHAYGPINGYFD